MNRKYFHYEKWEDYQNRMYDEIKDGRSQRIQLAIQCLGNVMICYKAMKRVTSEWEVATLQNLTNDTCNRRAWLGQAACNIEFHVKEDETREAYGYLTEEQRRKANATADKVISEWERVYLKNEIGYQYDIFDMVR